MQQAVVWPKFNGTSEPYMYFQSPVQVEMDYLKDDCDFFDRLRNDTSFYERERDLLSPSSSKFLRYATN